MASPRLKAVAAEAVPNCAGDMGLPPERIPQLVDKTVDVLVTLQATSLNNVLLVPPEKWHQANLPKELFFSVHTHVYRKYPSAPRPHAPYFGLVPPTKCAPSNSVPAVGTPLPQAQAGGAVSSKGGVGKGAAQAQGQGKIGGPPSPRENPAVERANDLFGRTASVGSTSRPQMTPRRQLLPGNLEPPAKFANDGRWNGDKQENGKGRWGGEKQENGKGRWGGEKQENGKGRWGGEKLENGKGRWGGEKQESGKGRWGADKQEPKGVADHMPGGVFRTASSLLGKRNRSESDDNNDDNTKENKENKEKKEDETDEMEKKILKDILCERPNVSFNDIIGLDGPKESLRQMIILPLLNPEIYTGLREPPKGLLMFGPGGNGKTFIAKAVASECTDVTFFNLSAASLTSKWLGESEKLMRALFTVAKRKAPSLIFIDEIDSILSKRGDTDNESSRRLKTEFLVQFDGVTSSDGGGRVIFLAATNRPWDLDEAALRRFTERFYVPLPTREARMALLTKLLQNEDHNMSVGDIDDLVEKTEGYAAFEVQSLCRRAAQQQMRELSFEVARTINLQQLRPLCSSDFHKALRVVRAANSATSIQEHTAWNTEYGAQD